MNNLKITKKMVSFKETVSYLSGEFPIRWDCFPFIGKTSCSLGVFPIYQDYFLFIGKTPHSLGKLPVNLEHFLFVGVIYPLRKLFPLQSILLFKGVWCPTNIPVI